MSESGETPGTDPKQARWDARYAETPAPFGDAPNQWLRMVLARPEVAPGSALMLADGDGRNGTWLAGHGLAVQAVDLSPVATAAARARDAAAGVSAERAVADLAGWAPPEGAQWDLAAVLFLHGPAGLRRHALRLAAGALAPGGWLVLEGFAEAQAGGAMGPDDPDLLYGADETGGWLAGLEVVEALTGRVVLDEGPRHAGEAQVLRLLARRRG
ncbi:MAG: methyltransferase domain-containing protein [Pseudomonadota bacterium]